MNCLLYLMKPYMLCQILYLQKYLKNSSLFLVIETISKVSKTEDEESKPLNNKLENEAVGKHNCSTSSSNAVSDNATTSNEANKSLRMKRNEEKNALSSNGKENEEFTQENLMRQKIKYMYNIAIVFYFNQITLIVALQLDLDQRNKSFIITIIDN